MNIPFATVSSLQLDLLFLIDSLCLSIFIERCNRVYHLPLLANELDDGNIVVQPACWEISRALDCKIQP